VDIEGGWDWLKITISNNKNGDEFRDKKPKSSGSGSANSAGAAGVAGLSSLSYSVPRYTSGLVPMSSSIGSNPFIATNSLLAQFQSSSSNNNGGAGAAGASSASSSSSNNSGLPQVSASPLSSANPLYQDEPFLNEILITGEDRTPTIPIRVPAKATATLHWFSDFIIPRKGWELEYYQDQEYSELAWGTKHHPKAE
jgi:hypothetical protein